MSASGIPITDYGRPAGRRIKCSGVAYAAGCSELSAWCLDIRHSCQGRTEKDGPVPIPSDLLAAFGMGPSVRPAQDQPIESESEPN